MKKILCSVIAAIILFATVAVCIPAATAIDGFYTTAELLDIKEHIENDADMDKYATAQGACTDGRYAYFAVQQNGTTILKYDMRSWKLVDSKQYGSVLGHANDMTYNPTRNLILVANNGPEYNVLTGIDPDTLEIRGAATIKLDIYSIAYNPDRDIYVVGISGGYKFAFLNNRFKVIKKFKGVETVYTRQGGDCDEDYIYFAQSGGDNAVVIYDYDGKYVDIISLGNDDEVENIFHVGKSFYTTMHYYGNSVHRLGLSDSTQIRFNVYYDKGEGYGEMKPTSVHYGERTPLRANSLTRAEYFFGGWRARRSADGKYLGYRKFGRTSEWLNKEDVYEYALYDDGESVAETVKFGSVTMSPFWIRENYEIRYDPGGAEGWMPDATVGYYDKYVIPENGFEMSGYVFAGFTAYRDYDGKTYGFRRNAQVPEWLYDEDLFKPVEFRPGQSIQRMTYDGTVVLKPVFRFAYTFNEDNTTLLEYIGIDETVNIPNRSGQLHTIATGAFKDNAIFTEITVPETVERMEPESISNCSLLRKVTFRDNFPDDYAIDAVTDCDSPAICVDYGGRAYTLGYAAGKTDAQIMLLNAGSLRLALSEGQQNTE